MKNEEFEKRFEELMEEGDVITDEAMEYGEPGYTLEDGKRAILFGNWNEIDNESEAFKEWLEKEFELEWCDEWVMDYVNGKAYRTQPDGYEWQPSYVLTGDGEILGMEEEAGQKEVVKQYFDSKIDIVPSTIDLEKLGYKMVAPLDECCIDVGWNGGLDRKEFFEKYDNLLFDGPVLIGVIQLESSGQFNQCVTIWQKK